MPMQQLYSTFICTNCDNPLGYQEVANSYLGIETWSAWTTLDTCSELVKQFTSFGTNLQCFSLYLNVFLIQLAICSIKSISYQLAIPQSSVIITTLKSLLYHCYCMQLQLLRSLSTFTQLDDGINTLILALRGIAIAIAITIIITKPYFKGFCWDISNISHGGYLIYHPCN